MIPFSPALFVGKSVVEKIHQENVSQKKAGVSCKYPTKQTKTDNIILYWIKFTKKT